MPWGSEHHAAVPSGEPVGAAQLSVIYDAPVLDAQGERVGVVVGVCREHDGSTWLCIRLGLFGLRSVAVPLGDAVLQHDVVVVRHARQRLWDAPSLDGHGVGERLGRALQLHYAGRAGPSSGR